MSKERLTKFVTPVGMPMTTLNSMKHYMPCVPCRHNAKLKTDSNGNQYTEKFDFCDTCEVKMLFNRLKEYEDLEEQNLLLRLPISAGSEVHLISSRYTKCTKYGEEFNEGSCLGCVDECDSRKEYYIHKNSSVSLEWIVNNLGKFGKTVFLTQSEAEEKLRELEGK